MNATGKKYNIIAALLVLTLSASACGAPRYAVGNDNEDFDLASSLGIEFPDVTPDFDTPLPVSQATETAAPVFFSYTMRVINPLKIYDAINSTQLILELVPGTNIILTDTAVAGWSAVADADANFIGYTDEGFLRAVNSGMGIYAELPIEYGKARDADNNFNDAVSRLVDIGKYLIVYYSTDVSNEGVDLSGYDVKVSMKLSTADTAIGKPFYTRNLCMLQYDTLQKLIKAIDTFRKDGYMLVIYDAYRPTSVQQQWFDTVQINNWVANPAIGLGGIHDRGAAIDIALIDKNGDEIEMPTEIYTMTDESSRTSTAMTKTARKNLDYMTKVMTACGFTYSDTKWWHFQDENAAAYLPTDHPIDEIPMVWSEKLVTTKRGTK